MMAAERGRKKHSVRDTPHRATRALAGDSDRDSDLDPALEYRGHPASDAPGPCLAAQAQIYVRGLQWAVLPFYGYIVLRSFISALERPGWALVIMAVAVLLNAIGNYCLVFGKFGFPNLGIFGSGLATSFASLFMFVGLAVVCMVQKHFRRYHLFGRFWRTGRFLALLKLGAPIAGILAFE
jgi:MATE family multidrug resistance protein